MEWHYMPYLHKDFDPDPNWVFWLSQTTFSHVDYDLDLNVDNLWPTN